MSKCCLVLCSIFCVLTNQYACLLPSLQPTIHGSKQLHIRTTCTQISKESSSTSPSEGLFARHSQTLAGTGGLGLCPVEYGGILGWFWGTNVLGWFWGAGLVSMFQVGFWGGWACGGVSGWFGGAGWVCVNASGGVCVNVFRLVSGGLGLCQCFGLVSRGLGLCRGILGCPVLSWREFVNNEVVLLTWDHALMQICIRTHAHTQHCAV